MSEHTPMDNERYLVTGAAGMVGSHVADLLESQGRNVYRATRPRCDLRIWPDTLGLFERVKPTHVFHPAACVFGIMGNIANPGQSFLENLLINTHVIDAARRVGVKKLTAMGTGCVYPYPPLALPLSEDQIFHGRPHPSEAGYAHAKMAMIAMLETYESFGMDWAAVISCNLFGPRDKFDPVNGHVVPALIRKFYEARRDGTDVTVWGNGSAQRDFIYIKDCAEAVVRIMDGAHGCVNMGTNSVWRIGEIIRVLGKISGLPKSRVLWDKDKPNGVDYRGYDLSRLNALGFKPAYSIAEGLEETWEWYCHEQAKLAH